MNNNINFIREKINAVKNIVIAGHTNPDADAIGACIAFYYALKQKDKNVYLILEDYSEKFNFIPGKENLYIGDYNNIEADLFISLDCGDLDRLGSIKEIFNKMETINIDHHISNNNFADINYVDINSSSTSEIVYNILNNWCIIDNNIAACIYAGLLNDTGGFRYTNTTSRTLSIASEILKYKFDFTNIYNTLFYSRSFLEIKLMGEALINSELLFNNKFVFSYLSYETINKYNATYKEVNGISEYLKGVSNTMISAFLYEKNRNEVKVSLRSEDVFDSAKFAMNFNGGGHKKAAGFTLNCTIDEACTLVRSEILDKLKNIL